MAENMEIREDDKVFDLGCGYGILGIVAAKMAKKGFVILGDTNTRAIELTWRNIEANKIKNAEARVGGFYTPLKQEKVDVILSNPPIRAGFKVVRQIVVEAPQHLEPGGTLQLVVRTKQGAKRVAEEMRTTFGNLTTTKKSGGYRVLLAKKGENR